MILKNEAIEKLVEQVKEIENMILSTILNHNSELAFELSEDFFYSDYAKRYIKAIQSLVGNEVNSITVYNELQRLKIVEEEDFSRLIMLQTTFYPKVGIETVKTLKKLVNQIKAYKKTQELQQKVVEKIQYGEDIDEDVITEEFTDFLKESENTVQIANEKIKQCIEQPDFELEWLFKDFILNRTVNILDGKGGSRKSRFAIQLAVQLVMQSQFLCFDFAGKNFVGDSPRVIYVTTRTENNEKIIASIIDRICEHFIYDYNEVLSRIIFIHNPEPLIQQTSKGVSETEFYVRFKRLCRQIKPELVIIDPLTRFFAADLKNENFAIFYNMLEKLDTTFLLIQHQPKGDMRKDAKDTTALGGVLQRELARARFVLQGDMLLIEKNNFSKYHSHVVKLVYEDVFKTAQSEPYDIELFEFLEEEKEQKNGNRGNGKKGKNKAKEYA